MRELAEEYEEKLQNEQVLQKSLQTEKESLTVTYDGQRDDVEVDGDKEIDDMKAKYEVCCHYHNHIAIIVIFNILIIRHD